MSVKHVELDCAKSGHYRERARIIEGLSFCVTVINTVRIAKNHSELDLVGMSRNERNDGEYCDSSQISVYLALAAKGDEGAQEQFCRLVYAQLRDVARLLLWNGQRSSFQPSALVNELFVRVFDRDLLRASQNRRYFFTAATDQMRKILIDHHRKKHAMKAGGKLRRVPIDTVLDQVLAELNEKTKCDLLDLENALGDLSERNPRQAEIVRLRFYGGLNQAQIADLLHVSVSTVERDWRIARAKLYTQLRGEDL